MKRYLLFVLTMLCAVTGAWADDTSGTLTNGSTWSYDSGVLTITFSSQDDYTGQILSDLKTSLSSSSITKLVINTASNFTLNTATSNSDTGGQGELYAFDGVILDLSAASLTPATNYGVTYYPMDGNGNYLFKNVIVPDAYKSDPSQFILTQAYNLSASPINAYSVDGTTINASFGATSNLVNLNNISSTATTLKVVADISGAIDLSTVASSSNSAITAIDLLSVTTGNDGSNTITVPSTVSVTCGTTEVGNRVSGVTPTLVFNGIASVTTTSSTNLSSSIATLLSSYTGATASQITSLTVTGPLTADDITYISSTLTGLTTLDLTNATGYISSLASSTVTTLTLPSSATSLPNNIATALPALSSPVYVYSYSNSSLAFLDAYVPAAGNVSSMVDALKSATGSQSFQWQSSSATIKIIGPLNTTDMDVINQQFQNCSVLDLSEATGITVANIGSTNLLPSHDVIKLPKGSDMPTEATATNWVKNSGSASLLIYSLSSDGQTLSIWTNFASGLNTVVTADNTDYKVGDYTGVQYAHIYGKTTEDFTTVTASLAAKKIGIAKDPIEYADCKVTFNLASRGTATMAELLSEAKTALGETQMCTIVVTGEMSATDLAALGGTDASGVIRIDMSGASVASGANINSLQIPTTLTSLVLPPAQTVDATLAATLKVASSLKYAYSPTTDNQTHDEQFVADYVWMNKAGGLAAAVTNEAKLKTAVYVKVESDVANSVALNSTDCDLTNKGISDSNDGNHGWQYIDLSGTLLTAQDALDFKAPHSKGFRIILPNNIVTNEHMAMFASNSNIGAIAAVYTYNTATNTLKIMECVDNSYDPAALADPRIMKSGTTEVKVVSGYYNGNTYATFGTNLLAALNNMGKSSFTVGETAYTNTVGLGVTKISIETTSAAPNALTFGNPSVTTIEIKNFQNTNVELNVDNCSALTTLDLTSSSLKTVDASTTSLTTANLSGTSTTGAADFSGATALETFNTSDETRFGGDLNLTSSKLTSFTSEATFGGNLKLNASSLLTSVDVSGATFTNNSSVIHVDDATDEENNDIISGLKKTDGIKVPSSFTENVGTRVHPYVASYVTVASAVAPAYTFAASDKLFHEKNADNDGDNFRYWYADTQPNANKEVTLGTSDSRTLADVLDDTNNASNLNFSSTKYNKVKVVGPVTSDDVARLDDLNCIALDLSEATFEGEGALAALKSALANTTDLAVHSNVKFLYLPKGSTRDELINKTALAGLDRHLYCVMSTADNDADGGIDLTCYSFESGSLQPAVTIFLNSSAQSWTGAIKPLTKDENNNDVPAYTNTSNKYTSTISTFKNLKIGGLINTYDLSHEANQKVDENGHLSRGDTYQEVAKTWDAECLNGTCTVYGPFSSSYNLTEIDLRDAYFEPVDNAPVNDYKRYYNSDMTLAALNIISTATRKVVIPQTSTVHEIPADFMNCATNIRAIMIPSNIFVIRTRAFYTIDYVWTNSGGTNDPEGTNTRLDNGTQYQTGVTTVEGKQVPVIGDKVYAMNYNTTTSKYEENTSFDYTRVCYSGTYTFGSSIKMIETAAFANTQPHVKDVYVLNTTAPECHVDAFNTVMYVGNGGYSPAIKDGIITRDSYTNNGFWITMLHYPRQTGTPNTQRYTDPSREYSIATGERDGKGAIIYFPNQSEFDRAYNQGTYGYTWNAWNTQRNIINGLESGEGLNVTEAWKAAGQTIANGLYTSNPATNKAETSFYDVTYTAVGGTSNIGTSQPSGLTPYYNVTRNSTNLYPRNEIDANSDADNSGEKTEKDYRGWHQFVLTAFAANTILDEEPYRSYIEDNEWWTICPEFDITRDEAALLFGKKANVTPNCTTTEYPMVHKLRYVRRLYENGTIYLSFTPDLCTKKEDRTTSTVTYTRADGESGEITGVQFASQHGNPKKDGTGIVNVTDATPGDNDVVMSAGVPYLIKPQLPSGSPIRQYRIFKTQAEADSYNSASKESNTIAYASDELFYKIRYSQAMSGDDQMAMIKNGTYTVPVFVLDSPNGGYTVEACESGTFTPNDDETGKTVYKRSTYRHYTFVGTFYKSFLPHYSYFLSWDASASKARFFYYDYNEETNNFDNKQRWANGTGVIVPTLATDLAGDPLAFNHSVTIASGKNPAQWSLLTTFKDDSFVGASLSRSFDMVLDAPDLKAVDNEQTGVSELETETAAGKVSVYSIDGQLRGGSLNGLKKGVYVVNGKKMIVK